MRMVLTGLLIFLAPISESYAEIGHGVSIETNRGLGYTFYVEKFWTGLSMNVGLDRFGAKQLLVSSRIFANYNAIELDHASLFVGATYADSFNLKNDKHSDKSRLFALTGGLTTKLSERIRLAAWVNLYGIHETETYDPATDTRSFTDPNRTTDFDFGGMSLSYVF